MYVPLRLCSSESLKYWENFIFRPDDVIIATYPKSGTNWALEIVPMILSGGDPTLVERVPISKRIMGHERAARQNVENSPSPRIFVTHYQYSAMPQSFFQVQPKVVNIMRNPKDVLISAFYYYEKMEFHANPGTLPDFLDKFLQGHVSYSSWFDHVKSWLRAEDNAHILYLTYEEMLQDLRQGVSRIAEFLGKPLEAEVIAQIADRCLFKNMKENKSSSAEMDAKEGLPVPMFRKGISGDWRNHLSEDEARHFDDVYEAKMKGVDFKFPWD